MMSSSKDYWEQPAKMRTFDMRDCTIWSDVVINQGSLEIPVRSVERFDELKLNQHLLEGLREAGIVAPRDIQNFAFPVLFNERYENVLINAPAATGKTTAALIKALDIALDTKDSKGQALLAYTTRDAAVEVHKKAKQLAKHCSRLSFRLAVKDSESCKNVKGKVEEKIVVGTPEKLKDYVLKGDIDNIRLVVLDGIDSTPTGNGHRMAVAAMYKRVPATAKTILLTSVPRDTAMDKFVHSLVSYPIFVDFPHKLHRRISSVGHHYLKCSTDKDRVAAMSTIMDATPKGQCVVVCDSKDSVNNVFRELGKEKGGGVVAFIHGKISPQVREETLQAFKAGNHKVLITTPTYRSSVKFNCQQDAMIINFDTQVSSNCLDHAGYKDRASILENIPGAFSVNMIKDKWTDFATDENGLKMKLCSMQEFEKFLRNKSASKLSSID